MKQNTYRVGSVQVSCVREYSLANFTPGSLLPQWRSDLQPAVPKDVWSAIMAPDREHVILSVHTWLARDRGHTILIDTGAGNDKPRPHAPYFDRLHELYLERLAEAGVSPEEVDYVLLTHLHVDHAGWNTRLIDGDSIRYTSSGLLLDTIRSVRIQDERLLVQSRRRYSLACLPCLRANSVAGVPASSSLRIPTICASEKRLFIAGLLGRFYPRNSHVFAA